MLRLIGMLIGSALAIGILIVALGVPQLSPPATTPAPAPEPEPEPVSETVYAPASEPEPEAEVGALVDAVLAPEATGDVVAAAEPPAVTEEHWYAFWSPFRSELAANGFVTRLQASTGMDYRVVKVKAGVYEVAFAYSDEADIETKLARIADATGLDLAGS